MAQQTIGIGAAPNDGTGDPIRTAFDKCNDNFTELYAGLTGLLDFKGSTDCSTNPNYPAASKGDFYVVSVAGKIGGASGTDVEVGDAYFAEADNAGGTQAAVGADWSILQGNTTGAGAGVDVQDETTPVLTASTLNFTGAGVVATDAGGGVATITIAGGGSGGVDVEDEGVAEATGATTLNFTGAGVTATDMGAGVVDVAISGGGAASGTSFPGSPTTDDLFYRTDRRIEYFYDGTRWLSTQIHSLNFDIDANPSADYSIYLAIPFKGLYDIYLERLDVSGWRSAAGEWDFLLQHATGAGTYTTIITVDGSGHPTTTWFADSATHNAVLTSSCEALRLTMDEVSGSATFIGAANLTFRTVG